MRASDLPLIRERFAALLGARRERQRFERLMLEHIARFDQVTGAAGPAHHLQ